MRCPLCRSNDSKVVDSRSAELGMTIRRRRQCMSCNRRYTTYERVEEAPLKLIKKDQTRESFDRNKLKSGIERACWKRAVTTDAIEQLVSKVEAILYEQYDREVPSEVVGNLLMEGLRELDPVAYVRFASVYRDFQDASGFTKVLEEIISREQES